MGKSTIAKTVVETYRAKGLGCHLFFIREKSNPAIALPTIAYKLAEYSLPVAEAIERHLRDVGELSSATLRSKFEFLLRKPLSEAAAKISSPVLIVLDAMDECGNHETRRSLLEVLRDGLPTLPPNFKFLITTRPKNGFCRISSPNFLSMLFHIQSLAIQGPTVSLGRLSNSRQRHRPPDRHTQLRPY